MLTEEEAKTKWCPEVRLALCNGTTISTRWSRYYEDSFNIMCIGSKCMAWRWLNTNTLVGYCGKAGNIVRNF